MTKGNTLKQGDKTPLKYRLFDADGENLNIAGKSAKVRLVYPDFLTIGYEKDGLTVAQDDTVTFTVDRVIPSRIYHVEIIVDDKFIFPSRADEAKFTVDKSSLGTETNIIEIVGVDVVVRKAVDLINVDPSLIIDEDKLVTDIISNTGIGNIEEYYQQFNDVIKELSEDKDYHSLPEIAGARGGHETLGQRLDETTAQLAQKANQSELEGFDKRVDELVLASGDSDVEVTDAHVSTVLNKAFPNISKRFEQSERDSESLDMLRFDSLVYNGDFGSGLSEWETVSATVEVQDGTAKITPTITPDGTAHNGLRQTLKRVSGHKYYFGAKVKSAVSGIRFMSNGFSSSYGSYDGSNEFRDMTAIITAPSNSDNWAVGIGQYDGELSLLTVEYMMVFDLTEMFGVGKEPTADEMFDLINKYSGGYINKFSTSRKINQLDESAMALSEAVYYENNPDLTNIFTHSELNTTNGWAVEGGQISVSKNTIHVSKNQSEPLMLSHDPIPRNGGDTYFISFETTLKSGISITSGGSVIKDDSIINRGEFDQVSNVFQAPSTLTGWRVGLRVITSVTQSSFEIRRPILINLTETFGAGLEPSANEISQSIYKFLNGHFNGTVSNYASVKTVLDSLENNKTVVMAKTDTGITNTKENYPVLCTVKMSNEKDITKGFSESPRPIGWLYYNPVTYDFYYSSGVSDKPEFLFSWDASKTWDKSSNPSQYRAFITKEGDVIFVWRGDLRGTTVGATEVRQNPIVYPSGDYDNPVEVQLTGVKPTAWLQNCGAEFIYNTNTFVFAEYTRPAHLHAHLWKVTAPFTDPDNWQIKKTYALPESGEASIGLKHWHTVNYDSFSGRVYATTGDTDESSKILESTDNGETWNVVLEGDKAFTRLLNFSFTKDGAYWASDDTYHFLIYAPRNASGALDFSSAVQLHDLRPYPPTYANVYLEDINALILFNRNDTYNDGFIDVLVWDIETSTLHIAGTFGTTGDKIVGGDGDGRYGSFGFRMDALNFYTPKHNKNITMGFASPINKIDILGNSKSDDLSDLINNLVISVIRVEGGFKLNVSAVAL